MTGTAMQRAFGEAGQDFADLAVRLWDPISADTVEVTAPQPGERVLDACCGVGSSAIPAAQRVGAAGRVDAVDLAPSLVEILAARAAGLPQLHPHHGDVADWDADGYDLVQSVLGIFFLPDLAAGTERLVDRARPGGRVGLTIWRHGAMVDLGQRIQAAVAAVRQQELPPRRPHPVESIDTAPAYRHWLLARGLTSVEVVERPRRLGLDDELAWLIITGAGFRAMLTGLTPVQLERTRRHYLDGLHADDQGWADASTLVGTGVRPEPAR